ncbi:MAG: ABC transporter ATP-binding protein [Betaproteobacteria bacterium]|nr:ABC transporter ATP-binding protein [Betaproteobacteria bacterium]
MGKAPGQVVLEVNDIEAGYNGITAVSGLTLQVAQGEVVTLLGPNGAGKTTTLLALMGLIPLMKGSVTALGEPVRAQRADQLARRGVRFIPDDRGIFFGLSVRDHLRLTRRRPHPDRESFLFQRFPALERLQNRQVGLLSGGEQQMLAIASALLAEPKVLLIDEMSLGLAPLIVQEILPAIREMAIREGIAIVLVEQHVDLALSISDRALVLNRGRVVLEGKAADLRNQRELLEAAYFQKSPVAAGEG